MEKTTKEHPTLPLEILRTLCPEHLFEEIEGDLIQKFRKDVTNLGKERARLRFIWNAFRFLRPGIILRNKFSIHLFNTMMLRNYLMVSLRNIRYAPFYALTNVVSLMIGIASCLVIWLFISAELDFDSSIIRKPDIYRIYAEPHYEGSTSQKIALTPGWLSPLMTDDFPEIEKSSRFWMRGKEVLSYGDKKFLIDRVAAVDSTFLSIFDFQVLAGDRVTSLDEPNTILLTSETALRFFNNVDDAVGHNIGFGQSTYKITGVLDHVPNNSHLQFDALISISSFAKTDRMFRTTWDGSFLNTYVLLRPGTNIHSIESRLPDFQTKHTGNKEPEKGITLRLQPLSEVHLGSSDIDHDYNNYKKFDGAYIKVFGVIAFFILLIASVNFMNLTTARASFRWKEIGVRKSLGAKKRQVFGQFIFESIFLAMLAFVLAASIDFFILPFVAQLIGRDLTMTWLLKDPFQIILMIVATIMLGLITGIYPSFYMTSFNMTTIFKGGAHSSGRGVFKGAFVVVQFGLAILMIQSTLVVTNQLSFMKDTDPGFNKDQIVLIGMNGEVNQKFETLKTEWLRKGSVMGVTASSQRIGDNFNGWGFKVKTDTGIYQFSPSNVNVDYDYLKVYDIKLKGGRGFSKEFATDKGHAFIINETMTRELNLKDPIGLSAGHAWYENDSLGSIIGVAKDFNYDSFHRKIGMLALVCHPEWGYDEISIKIDASHPQEAIADIQDVWNKNITSYPFTWSFLDDHFNVLYETDQQMSSVVSIMAVLSILISCMGLFALAALTSVRKTKEIGIRKVMGASAFEITTLLSGNFARLTTTSFILFTPLSYYALSQWLNTFAYRVTLGPATFIAGGVIGLLITLITISYNTIRSANANPVKSLRYE